MNELYRSFLRILFLSAGFAVALAGARSSAQQCDPQWRTPDLDEPRLWAVRGLCAWDEDGAAPGEAVLVCAGEARVGSGGQFHEIGTWDGQRYETLEFRAAEGTIEGVFNLEGTLIVVTTQATLVWNGTGFEARTGPQTLGLTSFAQYGDHLLGMVRGDQVYEFDLVLDEWVPFGPVLPAVCNEIQSNGVRLVAPKLSGDLNPPVYELVGASWVARAVSGCGVSASSAAPFGTGTGVVRADGGWIGGGQYRYWVCGAASLQGAGGDGTLLSVEDRV
ncbi:MAG: hypothetical protein ACOYN0_03985, partial [Phycisphaerales bacterium]